MNQQLCCFIIVCLLAGSSLMTGCSDSAVTAEEPRVAEGVLDLREWDFPRDGVVDVAGEFRFYWKKFPSPTALMADSRPAGDGFQLVPSSWNDLVIDGKPIGGHGYATYHARILLGEHPPELAFKFMDMGTAFSIWVDGEKRVEVGKVGRDTDTSRPMYLPVIVRFAPSDNEVDLVIRVSNFHHRLGGAWETIRLGQEAQIRAACDNNRAAELFLFGCFFIIGLYHVGLFVQGRRHRSSLFFGFFTLLIAFRTVSLGERLLYGFLQGVNWDILLRIEYLSSYAAVPIFGIYLYLMFPDDFSKRVLKTIIIIGAAFVAAVLILPTTVFSYLPPLFSGFVFFCLLYGLFLLGLCVQRRRESARLFLAAFLLLLGASINDTLVLNEILHSGYWVPAGTFFFVLLQAYLIAGRFSNSFQTIESQHQRLKIINSQYQQELTERQRAEREKELLKEKLIRAEKMETVGLMAGGIAHDLNNILSAIVGYPDLLMMNMKDNDPMRSSLQAIRNSGIRASNIVQDLLTLARRGVVNLSVINLNHVIENHLASPEHQELRLSHANIKILYEPDPQILNIRGAGLHIEKSLMNLILNAVEAQPKGGEICIKTTNRYIDIPLQGYDRVVEGEYVVLSVADKGEGIDLRDKRKIFEPFYTKKAMGRSGTGLGMSVVWGTMQDHNGYIDILTDDADGTIFELYFPATRETIVQRQAEIPPADYRGNGEHILVVDDIPEQQKLASDILTMLGYRVSAVGSGEDAVEFVKKHVCDLLVLDMIMDPGIDGYETYRKIAEIHPGQPAIIASGYAETERVKNAQRLGAGAYVRKPYTLEKIGVAVRDELRKSATSDPQKPE